MSVGSGDWAAKSFLIVDEKALNRIAATGSVGGELRELFLCLWEASQGQPFIVMVQGWVELGKQAILLIPVYAW